MLSLLLAATLCSLLLEVSLYLLNNRPALSTFTDLQTVTSLGQRKHGCCKSYYLIRHEETKRRNLVCHEIPVTQYF